MSFKIRHRVGDPERKAGKNRLIFEYFTLENKQNPGSKGPEIARDRIDKYLKAVGVGNGLEALGEDLGQIENHNMLPFIGVVDVVPEQEYTAADGSTKIAGAKNKIKSFKSR